MPSALPIDSPWLNAAQAAAYLGISVKVIYRAVRTGRLRFVEVDQRGTIRVKREWLDLWFESRAQGAAL